MNDDVPPELTAKSPIPRGKDNHTFTRMIADYLSPSCHDFRINFLLFAVKSPRVGVHTEAVTRCCAPNAIVRGRLRTHKYCRDDGSIFSHKRGQQPEIDTPRGVLGITLIGWTALQPFPSVLRIFGLR